MAFNNGYGGKNYQSGFSPFGSFSGQRIKHNYQADGLRYDPRGSYSAAPAKKHSGCKGGQDKKGRSYVSGWKYSRRTGLVSFFAAPYKNTSTHKSEHGRVWENWICKIQNKSTMQESIMPCLYDRTTGKVILQKLGFVMNPKGGRGGYVGTYVNR